MEKLDELSYISRAYYLAFKKVLNLVEENNLWHKNVIYINLKHV